MTDETPMKFDFTQIKDEKMKAFAIQEAMSFSGNNIFISADLIFKLKKEMKVLRTLMKRDYNKYEQEIKRLLIQEKIIDHILIHKDVSRLIDKIKKKQEKMIKYD